MNNLKQIQQSEDERFQEKFGDALEFIEIENKDTIVSGIPLWRIKWELEDYLHSRDKSIASSAVLEFIEELEKEVKESEAMGGYGEVGEGMEAECNRILALLNKAKDSLTNPTIQ